MLITLDQRLPNMRSPDNGRRKFLFLVSGTFITGCIETENQASSDTGRNPRTDPEEQEKPDQTNEVEQKGEGGNNSEEVRDEEPNQGPDTSLQYVSIIEDTTRREISIHTRHHVSTLDSLTVVDSAGNNVTLRNPQPGDVIRVDPLSDLQYSHGVNYRILGELNGVEKELTTYRSEGERDQEYPWADLRSTEDDKTISVDVRLPGNLDKLRIVTDDGRSASITDLSKTLTVGGNDPDLEYDPDTVYRVVGVSDNRRRVFDTYYGSNVRPQGKVEVIEYPPSSQASPGELRIRVIEKGNLDAIRVKGPEGRTATLSDFDNSLIMVGTEEHTVDIDLKYVPGGEYEILGVTEGRTGVLRVYQATEQ